MAKTKDYKQLSDAEIVVLVDNNIKRSVGYYDSEISAERQKVIEYYNGSKPKAPEGKSKYVSMDVYDAVESMKAALLETFSAGSQVCKFAPQGPDDVEKAEICTTYTDYVCFRQNDLMGVMNSVIHDGLTSRVGIAKVYWDTKEEKEEQEFTDLTNDELDMLLSQEDLELEDVETDEYGLSSGIVCSYIDRSQVAIEPVAPEEFLIESQAKSLDLDSINFCAHRSVKSVSELREMGFKDSVIDEIGDHEDIEQSSSPEVLARHENAGASRGFDASGYQDQVRKVMVYEAYMNLDKEGDGVAYLYRILKAGNAILSCDKVDRIPFVSFAPIPIAHAFYGSNFAEKVIATQNARTVLTRSILDHASVTNAPRYMVTKGGLTNPKELIDSRVGGLVNVTRPDAIVPMPQAPLNPFVFQTIKMLDEDKEDNTGVSRLSQGTNKDAVSKQNSAAMIEQLATMSQQRQKIIARHFANQFMKPLFNEVYLLCAENEDYDKVVQVAGNFVEINPSELAEKRDIMVELRLGYGEQERDAQKFISLHQMFSQDPALAPMYQAQNAYALMKDALKHQGILNVEEYLTPPDQLPPPQPDPAAEMQMQMAQKQLELSERQTSVAEQKAQLEAQIAQDKLRLQMLQYQDDSALKADQQDLKEQAQDHKEYVDTEELKIARTADDVRAIASPTG
mgnify:CR=1 FL=1|tara:strand:- start:79 stop:2115 length:2037 start_codon:yes stop_codon:yes gene_type:complete